MAQTKGLTPEEKWEKATIANNFIFYKIMRNNPDVCKELLEILLEIQIEKIVLAQEAEIDIDYGSKGIRLDVFARNESQAFNIEMQAIDTKELPERARYYQGVIDVDTLKSGQKYKELKDSHIIFICVTDIFAQGLPIYTFENLCLENTVIKLNDRTSKHFFIAENCDTLMNEEQKAFLKLVTGNKSSTPFTNRILKLVAEAKQNTQWRMQYMTWERQRTYDHDAGFEDGKEAKAVEAAVTLVKKYNASPESAATDMGAPLDKVLEALEETVGAATDRPS